MENWQGSMKLDSICLRVKHSKTGGNEDGSGKAAMNSLSRKRAN